MTLPPNISDAVVDEAIACIGAPYWNPGVGDMQATPRPRDQVFRDGISCSMLWNRSRIVAGLPGLYGTPYYAEALGWEGSVWEYTNPAKRYPPFTFFVNDDVDWSGDRSHVAVMLQNQHLIESDSWGGVHALHDLPTCHYYNNFFYAGLLADMPVFAGFPGYTASPRSMAVWIAEVCATVSQWWDVEIPGVLPVMGSIPELTTIWVEDRDVEDIRDLYGYSYAVDHDSFGAWQQRLQFFPFPWDMPAALWTFLMRAVDEYDSATTADDADGLAKWCANIQRPLEAYRYRYRQLDDDTDVHAWASDLVGGAGSGNIGDDGAGEVAKWRKVPLETWTEDPAFKIEGAYSKISESGGKKWIEVVEGS